MNTDIPVSVSAVEGDHTILIWSPLDPCSKRKDTGAFDGDCRTPAYPTGRMDGWVEEQMDGEDGWQQAVKPGVMNERADE